MHFLKLLLIQNMITWSGSRSQICSISSKYDKKIVLLHDLCEHQRKILSDMFIICYQKNEKNPRNASTKFIYVFLFISFMHQMMVRKEGFTSLHLDVFSERSLRVKILFTVHQVVHQNTRQDNPLQQKV